MNKLLKYLKRPSKTAFSGGELDYSLMNTLTGIAVSAVAYTVAVFTVIKGAMIIKKIKTEKNNGK